MAYSDRQVEQLMAESFARGYRMAKLDMARSNPDVDFVETNRDISGFPRTFSRVSDAPVRRRKRSRSPLQKLLDDMAGKAWKQYKRTSPNGKKSYMDIRSRVSRSQEYKKKAKRLKK